MLFKSKISDWGPKPFRVLDCWLKDKSFEKIIKETWSNSQQSGWGGYVLKQKIKQLKERMKLWNKEQFGNTLTNMQKIEAELNKLESDTADRQLTSQESMKRKNLQQDLWTAAQKHESLMRQKARSRWIKEGDRNSRYFHMLINSHRSTNTLNGVLINGSWVEEPNRVKEEVRSFFQQRYQEPMQSRPVLNGVTFNSIGQHENNLLVEIFTEEEIRRGVWDCGNEKSPSPDGLNFKFIKHFWQTMKADILRFLCEFHAHGSFPRGGNASFIALIPKVQDPQHLNSFRPISLIGSVYKIVAKVLANRLKKIMPTIIDDRQSAFIAGRHLLHSAVIANEAVDEARKKKKPCLIFKVDFERAYDSVSWNFLFYVLRRMGFCDKWIRWVEGCLKSASISVLVNGSPTPEFAPQKGLRQGDPLAPLLFNIAVEALTGLMREAIKKKLFTEFLVGSNKVPISILQYADDTLFIGEASMQNVKTIKSILRVFELASGHKINYAKSSFGTVGKSQQWTMQAAKYLNCKILSLPFTYLGIPIGANPRRSQLWDPILRKSERKLARWKQKYLSFGGRVTLIRSTLTSIPIYFLSFFRIPTKVAAKLTQIQRRFLWGGGLDQKKIAWVK